MIASFGCKFSKAARVKYKLTQCVKFQSGADLISKSKILKFYAADPRKLNFDPDYSLSGGIRSL